MRAIGPRVLLESAINRFESFESVEQLQSSFTQRVGWWTELLHVFDGELNSIYCHSRLVCHFEFNRCRPRFCLPLNQSENLMHNLRSHRFNTPSRRAFALRAKPTTRRSRFRTRTREAVIVLKALESWGNLAHTSEPSSRRWAKTEPSEFSGRSANIV